MSRLSTIRARAQAAWMRKWAATLTYERERLEAAADSMDVLCDIAEAAETYVEAVTTFGASWDARALRAALSRLGSPEGDGPDA